MRTYKINNIEYVSVTEIIGQLDKSKALMQWAVNCAIDYIKEEIEKNPVKINLDSNYINMTQNSTYFLDKTTLKNLLNNAKYAYKNISNKALDIGKDVHHLIENWIKYKIDLTQKNKYRDEVLNGFLAFLDWEKENNVEWLESELKVYSHKYCYAGTLDAIAKIKNKMYVIDFKNSKGFYDGYDLQIAAYLYAYKESVNAKYKNINNVGVLRLDKETGMPEFKDYSKNINRKFQAFLCLLSFFYLYKNRKMRNKRGNLK